MQKRPPYIPFSSFVLRTPLFPIDTITHLLKNKYADVKRMMSICQRDLVKQALFLASPDLQMETEKWINGKLDDSKKELKIKLAVIRYITRMSSRSTPFGLFAGISVGQWGEKTEIELQHPESFIRHTRLDMDFLCSLGKKFIKDPSIRSRITYMTNSSLYKVGQSIRFVEYDYINGKRIHHIVAVENNEILDDLIEKARNPISYVDLVNLLEQKGIDKEEATGFINELINSQIFISELEPAVTGKEYIHQLLTILPLSISTTKSYFNILTQITKELNNIDVPEVATTVNDYKKLIKPLKSIDVAFNSKYLIQTDMVKSNRSCKMIRSLSYDILKAVEVLSRITIPEQMSNLSEFKKEFFERYETREIPLLMALDKEMGIGYGENSYQGDVSSLIDDIHLPDITEESYSVEWNQVTDFLLKKIIAANASKSLSVELTQNELKALPPKLEHLNATFFTIVKLLDIWNVVEKRYKILIDYAGGSSAANLLGRFCYVDDGVNNLVKEIVAKEKMFCKDQLVAEIVHLPQSRVGNVIMRPAFRDHEINYLSNPGVTAENCIRPDDLYISIKKDRIHLRSKKLDTEIIPRQTTAHNYSRNALPVYQFLCDLQYQDHAGNVSFSWGHLSNQFDFLPRVTYKNIVFSLATWNVNFSEIEDLTTIYDNVKLLDKMKRWRMSRNIPSWILIIDFDNELLVHLENLDSIKVFLSLVKNRPSFQVKEFIFNPDNFIVNDSNRTYMNEFIFTFFKNPNN